ncbi:hypothetical protein Acid345_4625 [Candidatus Koribacter versatilis Ellin345]|uniref:PBS lyase HEAT-like repeat protein n=1 Tax=Koribacter versatilis (strain Ellin345) TaxID=204669 RepID=Q1IHM5_KORVE|nr:hypothetical protein [Candidatus Koribacter versatilis]ABF43625.1 hypothetical protein Acid345_4625 [Candidatus Koribacter versatilis Ellin345]
MKLRLVPVFVVFIANLAIAADKPKPASAKIEPDFMVIANQVIDEQWPAIVGPVNAPGQVDHIEPGQCIRIGVFASGDDRDRLLASTKIELQLTSAGQTQSMPAEAPAIVKQGKPEGGDFVTQVLGVANIKNPMLSMVSIGVPSAKWCAPRDTGDSSISIAGRASLPDGKSVLLKSQTLAVTTFATARQKFPLDPKNWEDWSQTYYAAPIPSRILPAMRIVGADSRMAHMKNEALFFVEALRKDPVAADDLKQALVREDPAVRLYGAVILKLAGEPMDDLLNALNADERARVAAARLPDPYDLTPDPDLANRMDMLWSIFFATGQRKPVETIVSMLAWRADYDTLGKKLDTGYTPKEITPEVMRGACYSAAGWALNSLSLSSPLVADYIEAIHASPDTQPVIRKELENLTTNPAFRKR